jgi:hypothetical protein
MQNTRKHQLIERTDYKARSPKRRKFGTTAGSGKSQSSAPSPATHSRIAEQKSSEDPRDTTQSTTDERIFDEENGIWPARAILKERRRGANRVEYLVAWEPHPRTGKTFEPSWEPRRNLGTALLEPWDQEKTASKTRDPAYQPTQDLPGVPRPVAQASSPVVKRKTKRSRPFIADSSSDIDEPAASTPLSQPPSLYRESDLSAEDDYGPNSPSLEIAETQAQSSLSTVDYQHNFVLEVPLLPADQRSKGGSDFVLQTQPSIGQTPAQSLPQLTSLPETHQEAADQHIAEAPVTDRYAQKSSASSEPAASNAVSQSAAIVGPEAGRLLFTSSAADDDQKHPSSRVVDSKGEVQIEASARHEEQQSRFLSSEEHQSPSGTVDDNAEVQIAASSGNQEPPTKFASSAPAIQDSPVDSRLGLNHILNGGLTDVQAGAHLQLPLNAVEPQSPPSLESIVPGLAQTQGTPSVTSSSWHFESQLPEIRRAINSRTINTRRQKGSPKRSAPVTPKKMDAPALRQSPRLQAATPVSRTRSPQRAQQLRRARTPQAFGESINHDAALANAVTSPLATAPPHTADYTSPSRAELSLRGDVSDGLPQADDSYDPSQVSALPIQQSIEEEPPAAESATSSKPSSSQASMLNERIKLQIDGASLPTQPVIGQGEYLIGLPAEGKIQSVYIDHINAKRKLILKFIHRRGSVGSATGSTSRTIERNEMIELIELLQDTTTHMDLGLPGFTQYSIRSEEEVAYAEYAGSKFVFLGALVNMLKRVDCTLIIACKPGPVQNLLTEYLTMRQVQVRRHDRPPSARAGTPEALRDTLKVDIISTTADADVFVSPRPVMMIAFDSSFDNQSPHILRIRELHSKGRNQLLPVVHLLVTNSAEHIDRCLRKAMPSPQRLKLLVRGTYLARTHLGGSFAYLPLPEEPAIPLMHSGETQRVVRKSANRMINHAAAIAARAALCADFEANWDIAPIQDVEYDEMDDTPPKLSENTTAAGTAAPTPRDGRLRTRSPVSRSATPMGRKRMLDTDASTSVLYKRQRVTPMRDLTPTRDASSDHAMIEHMRDQLRTMSAELAAEKKARVEAEEALKAAKQEQAKSETTAAEWQRDHSGLIRRYETQREHNRTIYKQNKKLAATSESIKTQSEKVRETNTKLRTENAELKKDLADARAALSSSDKPDVAMLEIARARAQTAEERAKGLERSLENTKRDFEFTRQQYQSASAQAVDLSSENSSLEKEVAALKIKASDEPRRLKELNFAEERRTMAMESEKLRAENRNLDTLLQKMYAENNMLKKGRGVQTRGSSAQPPNSPGLGGFNHGAGRRSRQASPAVGVRGDRNLAVPPSSGRD